MVCAPGLARPQSGRKVLGVAAKAHPLPGPARPTTQTSTHWAASFQGSCSLNHCFPTSTDSCLPYSGGLPEDMQGGHCQERWHGQVLACVSPHLAFAPALDVKIDAAAGRKFDPLAHVGKPLSLSPRCSPLFPRRLLTLGLGASTGTK